MAWKLFQEVKRKLSGFFDSLLNYKFFWNKHFLFIKLLAVSKASVKFILCHFNFFFLSISEFSVGVSLIVTAPGRAGFSVVCLVVTSKKTQ